MHFGKPGLEGAPGSKSSAVQKQYKLKGKWEKEK